MSYQPASVSYNQPHDTLSVVDKSPVVPLSYRLFVMSRPQFRLVTRWLFVAAILQLMASALFAADKETPDLDNELSSGIAAVYRDSRDNSIERIDARISYVSHPGKDFERTIDERIYIRWDGFVLAPTPGEYQLHVFGVGSFRILLRGQVVLDRTSTQSDWLAALPIMLPVGWHALDVEFEGAAPEARCSLFWSGPGFPLEPIGERYLFHRPSEGPLLRGFQRGRMLARALKCASCHDFPNAVPPHPSPALDKLPGNMHREWLVNWLVSKVNHSADPDGQTRIDRRMPEFGLSIDQANEISSFLLATENDHRRSVEVLDGEKIQGERLMLSAGCLACHRLGELGHSGLFGGGDLSSIAEKRPAPFFAQWLTAPHELNRHHRMPVFELDEQERAALSAFLVSRADPHPRPSLPSTGQEEPGPTNGKSPAEARGREWFVRLRCSACHQSNLDQAKPTSVKIGIDSQSNWRNSCVGAPDPSRQRPGYRLPESERTALRQFITAHKTGLIHDVESHSVLLENNCLSCHSRDGAQGLAEHTPSIFEAHPELAKHASAMLPPSLVGVGDKMHKSAMIAAIKRERKGYRPWLMVRMPSFRIPDQHIDSVAEYFIQRDRVPDAAPGVLSDGTASTPTETEGHMLELVGRRLVTTDGFGCTSCHQIGTSVPRNVAVQSRGPDLSTLKRNVRKQWFDRWVRQPARVNPRMEMPSIQVPVRGVLGDDIDRQLSAVWQILNRPGFEPPEPNPIRVLRRSGTVASIERAVFVTDVLKVGQRTFEKPLLVGFPNRHNALLDLETNRLAVWTVGDVARQRVVGKTWHWESAGAKLLQNQSHTSDLAVVYDGEVVEPDLVGQFPTEIDEIRHADSGVVCDHRLRFGHGSAKPVTWKIRQILKPLRHRVDHVQISGVLRGIEIRGCNNGEAVLFRLVDMEESGSVISEDGRLVRLPGGESWIELVEPSVARIDADGCVRVESSPSVQPVRIEVRYQTRVPLDQFPAVEVTQAPRDPVAMAVVPGFAATRLPIADDVMPTAIAWRPDGTLAFTSLKGLVWLARDTDGDGLEDQIAPFSDELAAPFGLACTEQYIDVINKYALLRLIDDDDDGSADRMITLASGWGHTRDYHDWVVGLPRDEEGNYYAATSCQTDQRSPPAARWRGAVLKLSPREPTPDDPRLYLTQLVCGGHRFPVGIARNVVGELFVTDNQGNYNPFNELNHVIPGARYGFINEIERREGFNPPVTSPAINIPHPWTRSVNGICFLDSPSRLDASADRVGFGPFEGHLIGCEYDTQRLIRMSLQRVDDTIQGAAYPFTDDAVSDDVPLLLGPLTCAVSPDGDLYVGCIRDSGWGGGNNIGSVVRLRPRLEQIPPGIAEVQVTKDGFLIEFTSPVDATLAGDVDNYVVASYTRKVTPEYGGGDIERRIESVAAVEVAADVGHVELRIDELRAGYVYEIRVNSLVGDKGRFFPAEAYYTLQRIPE